MISLFLANVACHELDREIERTGGVFARYADDTIIICDSYEKADKCARHLLDHGKRSGTEVNLSKSDGISLLSEQKRSEMERKNTVVFLGHSLSTSGVGLSQRTISRIKRRVARIICLHLLLQPKRRRVNHERIGNGFKDWDLVTCINELRNYIYGRISEAELGQALQGNGFLNVTRCAISSYPTVDRNKAEIFKALDGWLVDTLMRAYQRRVILLQELDIITAPIDKEQLISGSWYLFPEVPVETKLPSFFKSWLYVNRCAKIFGITRFPSPSYEYL